jgi:multiple sugar transport system substrate-binding protein
MKGKLFALVGLTAVGLLLISTACVVPTPPPPAAEAPAEVEEETQPAEPAEEAEAVTIRALIRPDEGENVATYAAKFEEETGIEVQADFVGWAEIHDKIVTTLAAGGGGYDIVFIPSANAFEFMSTGTFEPIDDLIPDDQRDLWLEPVVGLYTYEGNLLAMPWYSGGAHLVYNGEVLEAAGIDPATIETWDDLLEACAAIKESGAADFCFSPSAKYPGNFNYNWGSMVQSLGGDFFDEEGNPVFQESDAALKAFQLIETGVDEGYFDPAGIALDDYETLIEFGAGTTAFLLDSTWSATQATRNPDLSGVTEAANIMLVPGGDGVRSGSWHRSITPLKARTCRLGLRCSKMLISPRPGRDSKPWPSSSRTANSHPSSPGSRNGDVQQPRPYKTSWPIASRLKRL